MNFVLSVFKVLGTVVLLLASFHNYGQNTSYSPDEKVEMKYEGEWIVGTYVENLDKFSNMKATPHKVAYKTAFSSGETMLSPSDVRKFTGTLKPPVEKPQGPAVETVDVSQLNREIVDEINSMRTQPQEYAKKLSRLKEMYVFVGNKYWYLDLLGEDGRYVGETDAARRAHEESLDEAIEALNKAEPMEKLIVNEKLNLTANMKVTDLGGHEHTDSKGRSPQDRATVAGYDGHVEENLTGGLTAFGIVTSYLIDHNVPSRGHRKSLMRSFAREIGVANYYTPGVHSSFGNAVVLAYGEKGQTPPSSPTTQTTTTETGTTPPNSTSTKTSSASSKRSALGVGEVLEAGERLYSAKGAYYLAMQADGNLCIYGTEGDRFVWCSMAVGFSNAKLTMQADGNLCVNDGSGTFKWGSYQDEKYALASGYSAKLTDAGKLQVVTPSDKVVWQDH